MYRESKACPLITCAKAGGFSDSMQYMQTAFARMAQRMHTAHRNGNVPAGQQCIPQIQHSINNMGQYLYRIIRNNENYQDGLFAKDVSASTKLETHVMKTLDKAPWISCSCSLGALAAHKEANDYRVLHGNVIFSRF